MIIGLMRIQIVDPSAFTPPYDHSLSAALARRGEDVELVTSRFLYGPLPPLDGYRVNECFYRRTGRLFPAAAPRSRARRALKVAEHVPDMLAYRRLAASADVVHYQWLTLEPLDAHLLPSVRPRVLTAHNVARRGQSRRARAATRRLLSRMDAVVVHYEAGARLVNEELGGEGRVHVIPHGAFEYLTRLPDERPLPEELAAVEEPVILCFGLVRPYKGVDVLLEAFSSLGGAELWIVGMPRMPLEPLKSLAAKAQGRVRFVSRFVPDHELPAFFRRADLVVLPYREVDQSGVLFSALAFGKPLVLSAVGGFVEVAERHGAGRLVPPGDPVALASALGDLMSDREAREALAAAAARAAAGPYSWDAVAERTSALYRQLVRD